ncbi:MAG: DUF1109 domain-containing protein [Nitrospiraceae bacterium]
MIATPDLIESLAASARPVKRLRPPIVRAMIWLTFAVSILLLLAAIHGIRPDLMERVRDPLFVVGTLASLVTGVLATVAAFMISLPDRSRLWTLLPMPALATWVSTIGYGCLTDWVSISPEGMRFGETVRCFATLVLTSVPLFLAMLLMLRYAAPLRPKPVVMVGSLAVAAITATALALFHNIDATVLILLWNFGTAILIVGLGGVFGRNMFAWVSPRVTLGGI